jgi:peptidoglycan/LPS O-acetylase OafA/YrhL
VSVGALAMLATLWAGWLGGQVRPQAIRALGPPLGAAKAWFVRIGDASYSLYLIHTIVIVALRLVFHALGKIEPLAPVFRVGHPGLLDNVIYTLVCVGASIWLSLLSYNYVERPMVRMFRTWRGKMFDASRRTSAPN